MRWHERGAGPGTDNAQEVKLVSSSGERDLYESLAEIYSIIVTLDGLEKAYIKDVVTEAEYTETCTRLLKQYKSSLGDESVSREFVDLETFKRAWGVSVSGVLALQHYLIRNLVGMPSSKRTATNRSPCYRRASLAWRTSSEQRSNGRRIWWCFR